MPALNSPLLCSPSRSNWQGGLLSLLQLPHLSTRIVFQNGSIYDGLMPVLSEGNVNSTSPTPSVTYGLKLT